MANKPFPWMCGECGRTQVRPKAIEYKAEIKHDGKLYEVRVDRLEVPTCGHCGEQWFDVDTDKQINVALRQTIGLLPPEEIRKRRKALKLTQKDLAERIGGAVASLSRWENGSSIQSRSTDKLLRMFFRHPEDPVWSGRDGVADRQDEPVGPEWERGPRNWAARDPFPMIVADARRAIEHADLNPLELALLGRLLLQPDELQSISELVGAIHFSSLTCRHAYEAMLTCLHEHRADAAEQFVGCVRERLRQIEPEGLRLLPYFVDHVSPADRASEIALMLRNRAMVHQYATED